MRIRNVQPVGPLRARMGVAMSSEHRTRPNQGSEIDRSSQLRLELITQLGDIRRCLQKWHAAIRRISGDAASDILRGQGRVLALLSMHGDMLQRDMCGELGIRPQSLGEVLVKLERAGYIERETSPKDRRTQTVRITEAGRACVNRNRPDIPFGDFTDAELEQFLDYLHRAAADIERESDQMAALDPKATRTGL